MIDEPHGAGSHGTVDYPSFAAVNQTAFNLATALFFAVEVTTFQAGGSALVVSEGHGTTPRGTLAPLPVTVQATSVIRASDVGYRTTPTDTGGVQTYPALLTSAFAINRAMNLDPSASAAAAAWGAVTLANPNQTYDAIVRAQSNDGQPVRVLAGSKLFDSTRGLYADPPYSSLNVVFSGLSTPWFLSDTTLSVPVRDATYWSDQPLQTTQYLGTGGYEGPATLLGATKPKARGGNSASPINNVTPVLIDAVNQIYQYTDAPGTVVRVYEGGSAGFPYDGDTTNLYSGEASAGHYRTDNSRGLFQLGSPPVQAITADVTGAFPVAGAVSTAVKIALYLLTEDTGVPISLIDVGSFIGADTEYPYTAGFYLASTAAPTTPPGGTGTTAVGPDGTGTDCAASLLQSLAATLLPARSGQLRVFVLRALGALASAADTFDTSRIITLVPRALPTTLDPPTYRWRVAYSHNYTGQTSGLLGAATAARKQYIAGTDLYASAVSSATQIAYRRPNDHAPLTGSLLVASHAQAVANDLIALWGVRRRQYDMTLPLALGLTRDLGDTIQVMWPMDNLGTGQLGQIVGEQINSQDGTLVFQVLV